MDKRARSSIYHTSSGRLLYESSRYLEPSTDVEMIVEVINFDVKTIYDRLISGEIYIDPDIQRGYVWDPVKATYFFDSIVRGFPIPPIVLLVSSGKYIVLDGVQRILTIKKIINNEITLVALPEYHGKKFSQLNQEVRDKFLHRMLICFRVHVKAPNDIERVKAVCSIIRRLNIGQVRMTLTQILFITAPHSDAIRVLNSIARNDIFRKLAQPTETEIATLHDRNILLMLATCIRNNKILNLGSAGKTKNFRYIVKTLFDSNAKELGENILATLDLCLAMDYTRQDFLLPTYGRRGPANKIHYLPWTYITYMTYLLWNEIEEEDFEKIREILHKHAPIVKKVVHEHLKNIPDSDYVKIMRGEQMTFEKQFKTLYEKVKTALKERGVKFVE